MRASRRPLPTWAEIVLLPLVNIVLAFLVVGVIVAIIGVDPFHALRLLVTGALGSRESIGYTLYYATNFAFTGLAVALAFHAGLFNIGGEGQAYIGGLGCGVAILALDGWLPAWLLIPLAIAASALFGAAWAAVPAWAQAWRGSHIVITTIMFNFVASALMVYLMVNVLIAPGSMTPQSRTFAPSGRIPAMHDALAAIGITEPGAGSDLKAIRTTARRISDSDGDGYVINGVKTWCTFAARANVLMLLARTDTDRTKTHRGLSVLIVPKPLGDAHGFMFDQPGGGKMEGRPIDTIGYRGMHSYEIALENWWVPADHLIGEEAGLGKGFYYQMSGFENGRLQTAARAVGVMQAAYEAALAYANNRKVFGSNISEYQLTQIKLGRMAAIIQASRQFSYVVAKLMGKGEGQMEASMVKAYVCKAAEWVTREAMQIHGGFGYAEEYSVSRLFVDARVLSIFEGADETLCLKVIARRMLDAVK